MMERLAIAVGVVAMLGCSCRDLPATRPVGLLLESNEYVLEAVVYSCERISDDGLGLDVAHGRFYVQRPEGVSSGIDISFVLDVDANITTLDLGYREQPVDYHEAWFVRTIDAQGGTVEIDFGSASRGLLHFERLSNTEMDQVWEFFYDLKLLCLSSASVQGRR